MFEAKVKLRNNCSNRKETASRRALPKGKAQASHLGQRLKAPELPTARGPLPPQQPRGRGLSTPRRSWASGAPKTVCPTTGARGQAWADSSPAPRPARTTRRDGGPRSPPGWPPREVTGRVPRTARLRLLSLPAAGSPHGARLRPKDRIRFTETRGEPACCTSRWTELPTLLSPEIPSERGTAPRSTAKPEQGTVLPEHRSRRGKASPRAVPRARPRRSSAHWGQTGLRVTWPTPPVGNKCTRPRVGCSPQARPQTGMGEQGGRGGAVGTAPRRSPGRWQDRGSSFQEGEQWGATHGTGPGSAGPHRRHHEGQGSCARISENASSRPGGQWVCGCGGSCCKDLEVVPRQTRFPTTWQCLPRGDTVEPHRSPSPRSPTAPRPPPSEHLGPEPAAS